MKAQLLPQELNIDEQAYRIFAEIISCEEDGHYRVESKHGVIENVKQATSCLVEPIERDRVLVEAQMDGEMYITTILERVSEAAPIIKVQGGLQLRVEGGKLQIQSEEGIDITTLGSLSMTSEKLDLRADEGNVYFSKLSYIGKNLMSQIESISALGGIMNFIVDTVVQKSKTSHRVIEDTEYVRSRHINYQASHNMQMHGKNTMLTAEELVKLDGEQIHMG